MLSDKFEITDRVASMLHAVDALDWLEVRAAFHDTVLLDYTSLFGGEPASMTADELVQSWRGLLPGFDGTQHLVGPVVTVIRESRAQADTHVRGYHRIDGAAGGDTWMVAGQYRFELARPAGSWRIVAIKLSVFYQEGNRRLIAIARDRVVVGFSRVNLSAPGKPR